MPQHNLALFQRVEGGGRAAGGNEIGGVRVMALYTACTVTRVEVNPQVRLDAVLAQEVVCGLYSDDGATSLLVRPDFFNIVGH